MCIGRIALEDCSGVVVAVTVQRTSSAVTIRVLAWWQAPASVSAQILGPETDCRASLVRQSGCLPSDRQTGEQQEGDRTSREECAPSRFLVSYCEGLEHW